MRTLQFAVNGQRITKSGDFSGLSRGSENYIQCAFTFNDVWDSAIKVAEFGDESVLIEDNACMIPSAALKNRVFTIRVVGKDGDTIITTNKIAIRQGG